MKYLVAFGIILMLAGLGLWGCNVDITSSQPKVTVATNQVQPDVQDLTTQTNEPTDLTPAEFTGTPTLTFDAGDPSQVTIDWSSNIDSAEHLSIYYTDEEPLQDANRNTWEHDVFGTTWTDVEDGSMTDTLDPGGHYWYFFVMWDEWQNRSYSPVFEFVHLETTTGTFQSTSIVTGTDSRHLDESNGSYEDAYYVAYNGTNYGLAWLDTRDNKDNTGNASNVYFQLIDSSGTPSGDPVAITSSLADYSDVYLAASTANWVILYKDGFNENHAALLNADGTISTADIDLDEGSNEHFVQRVVWNGTHFGYFYDRSGTRYYNTIATDGTYDLANAIDLETGSGLDGASTFEILVQSSNDPWDVIWNSTDSTYIIAVFQDNWDHDDVMGPTIDAITINEFDPTTFSIDRKGYFEDSGIDYLSLVSDGTDYFITFQVNNNIYMLKVDAATEMGNTFTPPTITTNDWMAGTDDWSADKVAHIAFNADKSEFVMGWSYYTDGLFHFAKQAFNSSDLSGVLSEPTYFLSEYEGVDEAFPVFPFHDGTDFIYFGAATTFEYEGPEVVLLK